MNTLRNLLLLIICTGVSLVSCNEDYDYKGNISTFESMVVDTTNNPVKTKTSYSSGLYGVDSKYKNAYKHQKQINYNGKGGCSWTNYVLCASSIIRGKGNNYPDKAGGYDNKIQHCVDWCFQYSLSNPTGITTIENYCLKVDKNAGYPINCNRIAVDPSKTDDAVDKMLSHISNHHSPFIYISSHGGVGHYLILWSIYWRTSIYDSDVWYTDTLDSTGEFKSMSLSEMFDSNVMIKYNFLFLY